MFPPFDNHPGLLFVAATLLPVVSVLVLLVVGGLRNYLRPRRQESALADSLFRLTGGEVPGQAAAWIATAAIGLAFVLCAVGFVKFLDEHHHLEDDVAAEKKKLQGIEDRRSAALAAEAAQAAQDGGEKAKKKPEKKAEKKTEKKTQKTKKDDEAEIRQLHNNVDAIEHAFEQRWAGHIVWAQIISKGARDTDPDHAVTHGGALTLGYRIDHLSAVMFVMVTFIATLIHLFSIGYMSEENQRVVEDHEVHTDHGHLQRRGRFGRFFLYLSLFCFSMLNLVLADNLFQVFLSWELVGICSFLLISFYYERTSASNAANKAFITNRVGDAGFIIGLLILWTQVGTLNFQDIFSRLRCPEAVEAHGKVEEMPYPHRFIRGELEETSAGAHNFRFDLTSGSQVLIFPRVPHLHAADVRAADAEGNPALLTSHGTPRRVDVTNNPTRGQFSVMPYWMLVLAGLGIFLGCVGKSAQFPLHVWLPDAMEGPTPVSALIHAATMVAAGVYLVGRAYPIFTPEVLLTIAYTGGITLFVAATIAVVMTDIKKVLAYSTVSQLGYMMLALGVAGWAAGLFHLVTHACFKALLFLGSGAVIYNCHHQQDMLKMGGLYPKMKITALTMLMGVLAIAGTPLFSGWYSKDAVLAHALGFAYAYPAHSLLFILPLVTAGITTFYMFRMWFMTFTGKPRDQHVYEHAHESPWLMTVPLIILAVLSVCVAWPLMPEEGSFVPPLWDAHASSLEDTIHHAQPKTVAVDFGDEGNLNSPLGLTKDRGHTQAGIWALIAVLIGLTFALLAYYYGKLDPEDAREQFPGVHRFLARKWYFDELYSAVIVRPGLAIAGWCRNFDLKIIDGLVNGVAKVGVVFSRQSGRFDNGVIDGLVNLLADVSYNVGAWLRNLQTGYLRSYVLFLALAAVGLWVLLLAMVGGMR
jgi:NADH-quinone oxidoreductase subunit L